MPRERLLLALVIAGCGGASPDTGATALLRVAGAQFQPGDVTGQEGGPAVAGLLDPQPSIRAGEVDHPLDGTLGAGATSVVIALDGDRGAWILPAGVPDITAPGQPTFHAKLSFSSAIATGAHSISVKAVDPSGHIGPPSHDAITVMDAPLPAGALVVSLAWDTESDLDLRVVEPGGDEIWSRAANDIATGGRLDFDSNEACAIDGWRREDVVFANAPPAGHYVVRVDVPSLCTAAFANWTVQVMKVGQPVSSARGEVTAAATLAPHGLGAGLTAIGFDVP